ncbi:UbiD family decarboxylase [Urbifossiella limnaea]|uniref:4-hydroxybenzoate decarboxylase subunit C n=1 Tax=Urbifossiella limnaea TaxID=2528023 RepID=A0A517XRB6_9BACT|nr:UbiD family decarboxylase [Urbifossiella limnaea]QDU20056.1 4-hydroxybenzoate decarboxylase subunit C [Urbifossiella limnaea]
MGYPNLRACVADLERTGQLVRLPAEIDPHLDAAAVHRRVYRAGGPALLFERVRGTPFPMASNLFGTPKRARFLFRDALATVRKLVELKVDPGNFARRPWRYWDVPLAAWKLRPKFVRRGPVLAGRTTLSQLPQLKCWPMDGGPFVTLPAVYTEDPDRPGWAKSNLGMYRVQFGGNDYEPDRECGLHYQIHRGIGVHHAAAVRRGERLPVNIIVGGPPALPLAAVMPLPEGLPELAFAAAIGGRRLRLVKPGPLPMPAEADFVISGFIDPSRTRPEGPFGDHLGYYSLTHPFPVMTVDAVYHRPDAIWPFTVVGRPPQEDTSFGELIHDLTGPVIPTVIPGLHAVHAVDAAGVHPLLLAIGSERYVPYAERRKPQELLTIASAVLGQGQLSLAKYLFIAAKEDAPDLDIHDVAGFFRHVLERVDWETDLHFHTRTTIDTLDYSAGLGLNAGSKLVVAAAGPKRRELATQLPPGFALPEGFADPRVVLPGVVAVRGPVARRQETGARDQEPAGDPDVLRLCAALASASGSLSPVPCLLIVDDPDFVARSVENFVWVVFTRSDPASDVWGVGAFTHRKHWGCTGPLVIDARLKPHMPPPLEDDPAVEKRIDPLFARGGPLHRWG